MTDPAATDGHGGGPDGPPPVVRVLHGRPTPGELAAVVAVLSAAASAAPAPVAARPRSPWGAPSSLVRRGAGPVGWGGPSTAALPTGPTSGASTSVPR